MAKAGDFASRCKARSRAAENRRPQPLPIRSVCRPIALSKAEARSPPTGERILASMAAAHRLSFSFRLYRQSHEAGNIFRRELNPDPRPECIKPKQAQIFVAVAHHG